MIEAINAPRPSLKVHEPLCATLILLANGNGNHEICHGVEKKSILAGTLFEK